MALRLVLFSSLCVFFGNSAPTFHHPNRVISLPGAPLEPQFPMYSGFLNASSDGSISLFYILIEAIRVDPSTAPLLVWFNGGPGGSSLQGFFTEHGPYRVTEKEDVLTYNEFSWNQYANVLYLESPLGVGFSQNNDGNITTNDIDAAENNFHALRDFMTRVHPNYSDRDYYLSGQSYAGVYVPYFAHRLLDGIKSNEMENHNFKGFAIGNPVFSIHHEILSQAMQYLSYGLLPLNYTEIVMTNWLKLQEGEDVNMSDLNALDSLMNTEIVHIFGQASPINFNFIEHCYDQNYSQETYHVPLDKKSIACYGHAVKSFMNRVDVQTAFHVSSIILGTMNWTSLNIEMNDKYVRDWNIMPVYNEIFNLLNGSSFRVLIYHGDTDVMLSPVHTIASTNKIAEDNSMKDQEYDKAWRFYGDFAGIRTGYKKGNTTMDVLTVRGSGHSVPTNLPAQAFQMINNFLFAEEKIDYSEPIRKHSS